MGRSAELTAQEWSFRASCPGFPAFASSVDHSNRGEVRLLMPHLCREIALEAMEKVA